MEQLIPLFSISSIFPLSCEAGASWKYLPSLSIALHLSPAPDLISSPPLPLQGSLRKEFPQNIGGSDVCFFCQKRVYVMERLSAEGKFFHRSCFKCDYCGTTLRLSSYAFDVEDGAWRKTLL